MPSRNESPAAAYFTSPNIIHPQSEKGTAAGETNVLAAEAAARVEIGGRLGATVTGGAIKRGR
jgi:hypothetical protein